MLPPDKEVAVIKTTQGPITIEFLPEVAPNQLANFKKLAQEDFYNDPVFHRIISNFMIQGGDPNPSIGNDSQRERLGTRGPSYTINGEFNDVSHARGIVFMARSVLWTSRPAYLLRRGKNNWRKLRNSQPIFSFMRCIRCNYRSTHFSQQRLSFMGVSMD